MTATITDKHRERARELYYVVCAPDYVQSDLDLIALALADTAAAARVEALEEAAKVAEDDRVTWVKNDCSVEYPNTVLNQRLSRIASAIRALAPK